MTAPNPYGSMFPPLPERETATTVHGPDITNRVLSPYEEETERQRRALLGQQETAAAKATEQAVSEANTKAATEKSLVDEMAAREKERADIMAKQGEYIARATQRLSEARQRYEQAPTPALFGDRDTAGKAMLGLGLALGALGDASKAHAAALLGQQSSGPSFVTNIINMDLQRQREKIEKLSDQAVMAQTGLKEANEARTVALAEAELRAGMAYKRLRQIGEANLAAKGADKARIEGDQNIQALRAEELKQRDNVGSRLTQTIVKAGNDTTTTTRENKPGTQTKPGVEDVKETNRLDADITKLTQTIEAIEKNPAAWDEYRKNVEDWARSEAAKGGVVGEVRKVGQAAGIFNVAPEQGLKTDDGRRVHQGMSQVQTSIAKGYGGVITEGDRNAAGSELAQLGLDAKTAVDTLKRTRSLLENGRASFYANRGVQPSTPGTVTPPPGESTAAGGAVHGTRDTRNDADAQPTGPSPAGPPVETPANNPDDPNSMAPLPEDPNADSLPEATKAPATPRKLPGGVSSLGKTPASVVAAPNGKTYTEQQRRYIEIVKAAPGLRNTTLMKRLGLTEEDFR